MPERPTDCIDKSDLASPLERTDKAQYPDDGSTPQITPRSTVAGGFTAVYQSFAHALRQSPIRNAISLTVVNHKGGFDCPSCAWPDPDGDRHPAEFCENGAKAIAWETTDRRATPEFFAKYSIDELASLSEKELGDTGRITHPMVLRAGSDHYEPIPWTNAFRMIADELNALASPDEAMFYTSGRASNEAAFCYQLFVRQFGTNNLPDCSNMCHESSGLGLSQSIGIGKGTVKLDDFEKSDCIFIIGQNPGTNHPRMLTVLEHAARNGAQIISVNPLLETGMMRFKHPQSPLDMLGKGAPIASLHLPVKINGDVALFKGILKRMIELDEQSRGQVLDHAFIRDHTHGFEPFKADLVATSWEQITQGSGISREQIEQAAQIAAKSQHMITCWAMGITQHVNGVANVQTIVNLNLLRGHVGKPGAGLCPVRGHSNVQGDRTMGIWERMGKRFMQALGTEFGFTPPAKHGFDTIEGLRAMHAGRVKVFVALGGNFLSAAPDTEYGAEAFRKLKLSVQISTKLNRNHLITGQQALILPCLGRTEKDERNGVEQIVSCENSMGVVQESKGVLTPASPDLMSEVAIVCHLAKATLPPYPSALPAVGQTFLSVSDCATPQRGHSPVGQTFLSVSRCGTPQRESADESANPDPQESRSPRGVDWLALSTNYDIIRDHISRVVPGFEDYNRRVRQPGGFYLPNPPRDRREFPTHTGKAHFFVHPIPQMDLKPGQLLLASIRSHDQFNTTIYGEDDRYRGIKGGRRVIFMNRDDMRKRELSSGDWVDLTSHHKGQTRVVKRFMIFPYDIPSTCAAAYYPETNPLVAIDHVSAGSNQPASKSIVISVAKCASI